MTPSSTTEVEIWRPYEDPPVLTPAMTGGHRTTPPEELERLRRYLEAVVDDRGGGPVHTAVAFNAAYFGYEPGGEGYGNGAFNLNTFPCLTLGDETPALPVGALVRIKTGSDPLYAEIVYKEGRHPCLADGADVPAWVSGAPAGADGPGEQQDTPNPVRQELLIPDFTVFGPGLQLPRPRSTGSAPARSGSTRTDTSSWVPAIPHRKRPDSTTPRLLCTICSLTSGSPC